MKIIMGSHLTKAAKLSNDWGPALVTGSSMDSSQSRASYSKVVTF